MRVTFGCLWHGGGSQVCSRKRNNFRLEDCKITLSKGEMVYDTAQSDMLCNHDANEGGSQYLNLDR